MKGAFLNAVEAHHENDKALIQCLGIQHGLEDFFLARRADKLQGGRTGAGVVCQGEHIFSVQKREAGFAEDQFETGGQRIQLVECHRLLHLLQQGGRQSGTAEASI